MRITNFLPQTVFGVSLTALLALGTIHSAPAQSVARIAFSAPVAVSKRASYTQIFSMNPDGSGAAQLTSAAANSDNPAWSPNQAYIAFIRTNYLMVMRADGSGTFPVAQAEGAGVSTVDWSPDGTYHDDLYTVQVDPATGAVGTPALFAPGPSYDANWSPDGTKVAFDRHDSSGNSAIIVRDVASGAEYSFSALLAAPNSWGPSWNPDSTMLAFQANVTVTTTTRKGTTTTTKGEAFIAQADGSGLLQVTPSSSAGGDLPTWSPDGTTLAFQNGGIYKTVTGSGVVTFVHAGNSPDWAP